MLWQILAVIIIILLIIVIIQNNVLTDMMHGVLLTGNIKYSDLTKTIKKMYYVRCPLGIGKKLNISTYSVSHHGILCILDNTQYILSRIENVVQILEVKKMYKYGCEGIDGYKYEMLHAFVVDGLTMDELISVGLDICSKHNYFILNHNCQEFVYDILVYYNLISKDSISAYKGGRKLFATGLSEILNGRSNA